ncbi:putative holin-like toxin [Neobacillus mesonae]|nr:putative holin-like toxin [Neobacillus mesonae]MCM3568477.1 putative holin-like toxin [Neobacillus mesonae]
MTYEAMDMLLQFGSLLVGLFTVFVAIIALVTDKKKK